MNHDESAASGSAFDIYDCLTSLHLLLDGICDRIAAAPSGDAGAEIDALMACLSKIRSSCPSDLWRSSIVPVTRMHPAAQYIYQCPLTRYSFEKPRGYAGDAGLLDLIYQHRSMHDRVMAAPPIGRAIYGFTSNVAACAAARQRCRLTAELIDQISATRHRPRILAVACGHLREAGLSRALQEGAVDLLVALDQDIRSLSEVDLYQASVNARIVTHQASILELLKGRIDLGRFDLIYSAGLYDYLDMRTSQLLTSKLFKILNPGGSLLIGNFLATPPEASYMEAYMDWWLLYRDRSQIESFASSLPAGECASMEYFSDPQNRIGYLRIDRS